MTGETKTLKSVEKFELYSSQSSLRDDDDDDHAFGDDDDDETNPVKVH